MSSAQPSAPPTAEAYRNQVGGHFPLLYLGPGQVGKPASDAEIDFYETCQARFPDLLPFIPKYAGALKVVPIVNSQSSNNKVNQWAMKCHERRKTKLSDGAYKIIRLEDLTKKFKKPNVLDIKLGTQQHSADDPPEKIKSKQLKVSTTTSAKLGLRFCGSQVYHPKSDSWVYRDKYYGRKLDETGLSRGLREYFWNGTGFRFDAIRAFLKRTLLFQEVLNKPSVFLFRSSSILLVFEGEIGGSENGLLDTSLVDLRLIDFAHTEISPQATKDDGVLLGVTNLVRILQDMVEHEVEFSENPGSFLPQQQADSSVASPVLSPVRLASGGLPRRRSSNDLSAEADLSGSSARSASSGSSLYRTPLFEATSPPIGHSSLSPPADSWSKLDSNSLVSSSM